MIGQYLKYSKSNDLKLISPTLYDKLKFTHEEFLNYKSDIEEGSLLFNDLEKYSEEIFQIINSSVFLKEYKWATHEKLKSETNKIYNSLENITSTLSKITQNDCNAKGVSIFNPISIKESEKLVEDTINNLKEIAALHKKGATLAGATFNDKNLLLNLKINFTAIFNPKYKKIYLIRKRIPILTDMALELISKIKRFHFRGFDIDKYGLINNNISRLLLNAQKIKSQISKIKKTGIQIKKITAELIKIKENSNFVFDLADYTSLGNINNLYKYYLNLKNKIDKVKSHLASYESYHNWKFFCNDKNELLLHIFSDFKNVPLNKWSDIFIAWYYRGVLLNYGDKTSIGFHKSDSKLQQLTTIYNELGEQQIKQIESIWYENRASKLSQASFNFNTLYNFRRNNFGPKNSLRKIIEKDFGLFTALFPVILTNPNATNAILPLKKGIFNIVIFDEASQLKISDTFTSLIRGQHKIIAGDEHQMPPSNYFQSTAELLEVDDDDDNEIFNADDEQAILAESESLLQYANTLDKIVNKSSLDFHYRSDHPALIEFSNHAFYGGNLVPFPAQEVYKPIEFRAINGRYETRTNPSEVAAILNIIQEEIHPNNKGKYPSVGIATFNINQRNLITEALNEAAERDQTFATKIQELKARGLFVKNLENIQGDEKDIMIISTTYGIKPDGTFSQNFARLNRIEGYKLLNVLVTRAKHKIYVCTSIPKEKYLSYPEIIENEGNNRKGILYAYLAYAEAISNHDTDSAENILKTLKKQSFEKPKIISNDDGLSESPFEEEVYELLLDHFKKDEIIQQYNVGGFRLDFVIKTGKKDVVLECDGKSYHQTEEAYAYDMYRQKELESMGFIVYRIWSTNWFQDKETEIKKLLDFVKSLK